MSLRSVGIAAVASGLLLLLGACSSRPSVQACDASCPIGQCRNGVCLASPACPGRYQAAGFPAVALNTTPFGAMAIAAGDLNGDGLADAVVLDEVAGSMTVALGSATGFAAGTSYALPATFHPMAVAIGDLTGDGYPDVVVASAGANRLDVHVNTGTGELSNFNSDPPAAAVGAPTAVVIADLNGDGKPDLVAASFAGNAVYVALGTGGGTFATPVTYPVGAGPRGLVVADLDGDGLLDVATANETGGDVSILYGTGAGALAAAVSHPVGGGPGGLAVGDLDGDHRLDLVVSSRSSTQIQLLRGLPSRAYDFAVPVAVGAATSDVALRDLDGDGKLDIALVNLADPANPTSLAPFGLSVLWNDGAGTFTTAPERLFAAAGVAALATGDLDGDGRPDLLFAGANPGYLAAARNRGARQLASPETRQDAGTSRRGITLADVDGDGRPDVITADGLSGNTISIYRNVGGSSVGTRKTYPVGTNPYWVAASDLNGDGRLDLAVANHDDDKVGVLLADGQGGFKDMVTYNVSEQPGVSFATPRAVSIADLNGDGKADLMVVNSSGNNVAVLLGAGDGTFGKPKWFPTGQDPYFGTLADVDGDGRLDAVTVDNTDNTVSVLKGNGDGTFAAREVYPVGVNPHHVLVVDLNGDGRPDLVVSGYDDGRVSVRLNSGGGFGGVPPRLFGPAQSFPAGFRPYSLAAADLDGDGHLDVVAGNGGDLVSFLRGKGDGTFEPPRPFPFGASSEYVAIADIDGDLVPDIITSAYNGDRATVQFALGVCR